MNVRQMHVRVTHIRAINAGVRHVMIMHKKGNT
jgi:hypothetical protein